MKYRVFISSVQSEFARERKSLAKYIREDALLGDFFEVFLFEEQPAKNRTAKSVFLEEVAACDVYLGYNRRRSLSYARFDSEEWLDRTCNELDELCREVGKWHWRNTGQVR